MTKATRPVVRETEATVHSLGKRRPIVVGLDQGGMVITFRLKQHRQLYSLPVEWCFWRAVEAHVNAQRRAKREARRHSRKERR